MTVVKRNLAGRLCGLIHPKASKDAGASFAVTANGIVATAVAVSLAALANHMLAVRAEQRNPPQGKFISIDGVRLHYIERGTGPVVVLLHGNGTMAKDFLQSGVLDLLAQDHRVIAFDRPGYGFSERPRTRVWTPDAQAELLSAALDELGVSKAVIVGHSWGTLVAIALALRNPAAMAGLVLLSGYYFPSVRADVAIGAWPSIPLLGDVLRYTISPLIGRLMAPAAYKKMFAPSPVPPHFAREFPLELAVRPSQIRASAAETALMIPAVAGLAEHYRELSMPVAIVSGADDKVVDAEGQSGRLNGELPQSVMHYIPGAGHMLPHIVPDEIAGIVRDIARPALC